MKVYFTLLTEADLEWLRHLRNANRKFFNDSREILHPEEQLLWFRKSSLKGDLNLIVRDRETTEAVGFLSIYNRHLSKAEIGRLLVVDRLKHKGYMSSAITKVMDLCRVYLGIEELSAEVKLNNIPSRELFNKLGFIIQGFSNEVMVTRRRL